MGKAFYDRNNQVCYWDSKKKTYVDDGGKAFYFAEGCERVYFDWRSQKNDKYFGDKRKYIFDHRGRKKYCKRRHITRRHHHHKSCSSSGSSSSTTVVVSSSSCSSSSSSPKVCYGIVKISPICKKKKKCETYKPSDCKNW